MGRLARLLVALAVALALPWASAAQESPSFDAADRAAIQALIADQIAAFGRDDGAAAYALAAPGIQDLFPTVEAFMAMVRGGYEPVYRPQAVAFGTLVESSRGPVQPVFVTGPDGGRYVAIYLLERQPDGAWLIAGCTLGRDTRPAI